MKSFVCKKCGKTKRAEYYYPSRVRLCPNKPTCISCYRENIGRTGKRRPQSPLPKRREGELGAEKWCPRCREYLPNDTEFFGRNKRHVDGLMNHCKACASDIRVRSRQTRRGAPKTE